MRLHANPFSSIFGGAPRRGIPCVARRPRTMVVLAAKKGSDKKGGDKKGAKKSALADLLKKKEAGAASSGSSAPAQPSQYDNPETRMLAFQMCDSYWRLTGKYLLEGVDFQRLPAALYRAPFALLAHNKFQEGVTDPIYIYGNRAALELFETSWEELLATPSRKSAAEEDAAAQQDRNGLLERAAQCGYVTGYEGWRVSKGGRRFKIREVTLFNIMDREGTKLGQAAVFDQYELEDGTVVRITADPRDDPEAAAAPAVPTPEEVAAAEAAVAQQAAHVRALKEEKGMSNQDIPVQIAVLELKQRKEALGELQRRLQEALEASRAAFEDEEEEGEGGQEQRK
ncbi:hypothetical protein Agub_g998 [Astrephomene gubernaculifera]|uniref:WHEP-TRS domain-containing protein n=1 Tax=Astrephomene gubernaculifera TaxID=47775 RepID=A0AAD3DEM7_9CHLO|nr:hypothetical protein Agub_g998 [Astrephomene gubernaculifera]